MGSFEKILVAFDGSDSGKSALRQALAGFQEGWIRVLAVVPAYEGDLELVGVRDREEVRRGPREELLQEARELVEDDTARVQLDVEQGDAFQWIIDTAENESCNLIVMGRRGLSRLERMLMGSVTRKVIVHSKQDVLVIPREAKIQWDKIVLATDGSDFSRAALEKAIHFAGTHNGMINAVSVVDMYPEFYADAPNVVKKMEQKALAVLDNVKEKSEAAGVKVKTSVVHGDPAEEITNFAQKESAGIVFMGSRGRTGLKKIFVGSVAQKVIGLSCCPIFVAKPQ